MSRTNKDKPWWVQSTWYEPVHRCCRYDTWRFGRPLRECDLPPEPVQWNYTGVGPRWPRQNVTCAWEPKWPRRRRYNYTRPPTRVDKHLGWWGPDRRDVRDLMNEARKQYHGYREVEILEPVQHHRHAAKKGWWD